MLDVDALADSLAKRGYRLHCTTIMHDAGKASYFACATKPGKPPGDGPRGFGRTPMKAYESLAMKDMHKEQVDALASALGGLLSAYRRSSDAF